MRVKEHLIRNSVRITSWILEITRTQQHIDSQQMPRFSRSREHNSASTVNKCQCSSERIRRAKARAKSKGKGKGKDIKGKDKAKDVKDELSKKAKSDDQRKCFYCNKTGHVRAECRKRLKDLGEAESTRHSSGRAVAVLTPRQERLVNVCHSHALCEQRNVLRVFQ